ncbi:MAG TPA: hypothetical protein VN736_02825 [Candidatus Limnocylindrales bacterium]|nr:hypothetical protein [Candidatus Limnocylindrales bacterium]
MNKPVVGIAVGAALGVLDGATAWFEPKVRPEIAAILMGSGVKGMVVGLLAGFFARKVSSTRAGIAVGAGLGLLFAWLVAMMPQPDGSHYYVQIMLPGFITGAIIGFLTQRMGTSPKGSSYAKTSSL